MPSIVGNIPGNVLAAYQTGLTRCIILSINTVVEMRYL